jgi:hypothetical protein
MILPLEYFGWKELNFPSMQGNRHTRAEPTFSSHDGTDLNIKVTTKRHHDVKTHLGLTEETKYM